MKLGILIFAVFIGLLRPAFIFNQFNSHIQKSYEAFAHILVGGLLAGWWLTGEYWMKATFLTLTAIELLCAAATAFKKKLQNKEDASIASGLKEDVVLDPDFEQ